MTRRQPRAQCKKTIERKRGTKAHLFVHGAASLPSVPRPSQIVHANGAGLQLRRRRLRRAHLVGNLVTVFKTRGFHFQRRRRAHSVRLQLSPRLWHAPTVGSTLGTERLSRRMTRRARG